jgi:hypothetical protein
LKRTSKSSSRSKQRLVTVNDRMQKGYRYQLVAPIGRDFDPEFKPELTPKQMLALGVFGGKYMTDSQSEFPKSWFWRAKLSPAGRDCSLNYFGVDAGHLGVATQGMDPSGRPTWLVPVALPLLHGSPDAAGGQTADQALEGIPAPHRASAEELRSRRSVLPASPTAGAAAVGL